MVRTMSTATRSGRGLCQGRSLDSAASPIESHYWPYFPHNRLDRLCGVLGSIQLSVPPTEKVSGTLLGVHRITTLWYFRTVRYGIAENCQAPLHKKYGPIVRIAPDTLAIREPSAIETIYGPKRKSAQVFVKAPFYEGFRANIPGARNDSFPKRVETKHAERRKIQAPSYTQAAVLSYEPCVDRIVQLFKNRMSMFAEAGELRRYAFDVLGEIFFGQEGGFGMVEKGVDCNGWCNTLTTIPNIGASNTYLPYGLRTVWMLGEIIFGGKSAREGVSGTSKLVADSKAVAQKRLDQRNRDPAVAEQPDMLNKLIDVAEKRGMELGWSVHDVTTEVYAVIWAGADTTAIALTSIFYHVHKNPAVLARLRTEIDAACENATLSVPVQYNVAIKLPYLNAVVKEGLRIHHSLGTGLPRLVAKGGASIPGRWIPGGTTVIVNANAIHMDKTIFGEDADVFNPDRWLDGKRAAVMARHVISFGYGPRICVGRHITMVEMYKLLPTLLREYHFEFKTPETEWNVWHGWFQHQRNVNVRVKERTLT
ncbi:hypothetical protein LTR78_004264 [Recurvomyces mirabilis]|uniref:Pisatin demethylase n=1 Tax=Recurvomyces mirabilis TaxID=574656 RepID=A0AAE0WQN7_9PEZI|nr:hypothetical protein LTR78_004264 [Recurvomyces mirabilis]KAK5153565.1 hypothetical protein LTS14_007259 [Recurvomyces mirabilis]